MPRESLLLNCLLDCLDRGFRQDLIYWISEEEKIFELYFKHGNKKKGFGDQMEWAQVWLEWDRIKDRIPDFKKMTQKEINEHLTEVRQRFRQAIKAQVFAGTLEKIETFDKHRERYRITSPQEREEWKIRKRLSRRRQDSTSSSSSGSCTSSPPASPCNSSSSSCPDSPMSETPSSPISQNNHPFQIVVPDDVLINGGQYFLIITIRDSSFLLDIASLVRRIVPPQQQLVNQESVQKQCSEVQSPSLNKNQELCSELQLPGLNKDQEFNSEVQLPGLNKEQELSSEVQPTGLNKDQEFSSEVPLPGLNKEQELFSEVQPTGLNKDQKLPQWDDIEEDMLQDEIDLDDFTFLDLIDVEDLDCSLAK